MPEIRCQHENTLRISTSQTGIPPKNGVIYWHIKNFTPDMEKYKVILAFEKGFNKLASYFNPVRFESTSNPAIAPIQVSFRKNGDPELPEPFEKNVLAYAYLPARDSLGLESDIFFNEAITWSDMHEPSQVNLYKVFIHECLHSLGLYHSSDKRDIMYPTYQPNDTVILTADTLAGIEKLYGLSTPVRLLVPFILDFYTSEYQILRLSEDQMKKVGDVLGVEINPDGKTKVQNGQALLQKFKDLGVILQKDVQ